VVIVDGKGWHEGVIGIVAARVARIFEKPCIVLSEDERGILKGSGRSYGAYDLFRLIDSCREHLDKFGGHKAAIGLSLSKSSLNAFKADVERRFYTLPVSEICIDADIVGDLSFSEISFKLTEMMKKYEPYGEGNPRPKFMTENVEIVEVESMGKEGEHRRFSFRHGDVMILGVQFKTTASYRQGERVTLFYTLNENHFRGTVSLQLNVEKIVVE